jgi:hypothetical protein
VGCTSFVQSKYDGKEGRRSVDSVVPGKDNVKLDSSWEAAANMVDRALSRYRTTLCTMGCRGVLMNQNRCRKSLWARCQ